MQGFLLMVYVSGLLQVKFTFTESSSVWRIYWLHNVDVKKTTLHRSYFLYPKNMNTYNILELFDDK